MVKWKMAKRMDMGRWYTKMEIVMLVDGKMIIFMGMEPYFR